MKLRSLLNGAFPKTMTKLIYYKNFHKKINMKNPNGINEKLQVLKLKNYYENDIITECVDKYRVRNYLEQLGLKNLLPELYGCYDTVSDFRLNWNSFPKKFVIKCNHGCGYNILINDKSKYNLNDICNTLTDWMNSDYWKKYCEPQYKDIKKKIIVEEYLGDDIQTYKFYCFNGIPKVSYVSSNGENGEKDLYLDYYDINWNWLPITLGNHLHSKTKAQKPLNYENMVNLAKILSKDFPFVRVDLYNIDGNIYFSELTFIPTGGMMKLSPSSTIDEWGNWLDI